MLAAEKAVIFPRELSVDIPHELAPSELMERLSDARRRSDELFNLVRAGSLYERPIPERHRIIFYVGHREAFDWNLLNGSVFRLESGLNSLHPEFDRLFAFGIDPVGGGLPSDVPSDWPPLDAVRDYVNHVRNTLDENLASTILEPNSQTRDGFPLRTLLNVAVEHRLMHVETLAYMLHQLPLDAKVRQPNSLHLAGPPVVQRMMPVPAGKVTLGLARGNEEFGWDNEFEAHTVDVPAFEIDRYKVTNRQYLEFMAAGGYETRAFWNDDDWNWKTTREISHPLFWRKKDHRSSGHAWAYRTMFDEIPFDDVSLDKVPLDWPVYVSQA